MHRFGGMAMKHLVSVLCAVVLLAVSSLPADACVGRILTIGIGQSADEVMLAEMISVLVNERTGTNVKVVQFKDSKELYAAVRKGEVGLVVEFPDHGLEVVGKAKEPSPKASYESAKREYRKTLNMVWLEPVGLSRLYSPVLTMDVVSNLPALPKLLGKLSGVVTDDSFAKLVKAAKGDDKPRRVARDFLKSKKLI